MGRKFIIRVTRRGQGARSNGNRIDGGMGIAAMIRDGENKEKFHTSARGVAKKQRRTGPIGPTSAIFTRCQLFSTRASFRNVDNKSRRLISALLFHLKPAPIIN